MKELHAYLKIKQFHYQSHVAREDGLASCLIRIKSTYSWMRTGLLPDDWQESKAIYEAKLISFVLEAEFDSQLFVPELRRVIYFNLDDVNRLLAL
jgi:hypothetical protein